jgi:hypothetical protein
MAYLGNTPGQATILRVEARKSFSLGLWVKDSRGRAIDLSGSTLTIVAKTKPIDVTSDTTNLLAADAVAIIATPTLGYARFDIQAATLNQVPGEYDYAIVLRTPEGYSSVIVKGILDIQQNTEYASVGTSYPSANPPQSLSVLLQGSSSISVFIGGQLPPGMNYVRDEVMQAIEDFDPDAIALVPVGGVGGYVLTKTTGDDYSMAWLPVGNGAFALDATGQPAGYVPAAVGDDTWIWAAVGIDATGVTAGYAPVANGDGTWGWAAVAPEVATPDWTATIAQPGYIANKPSLGTAAAAAATDFMNATTLVAEMPGIHFQTTIPLTGTDLHLYFVYSA